MSAFYISFVTITWSFRKLRGDKPRWIRTGYGSSKNMSIGSNCRCWMCQAVMKFIDQHHFTTGRERQQYAEKLVTYLAYRMGYTGTKITKLKETLPKEKSNV